MTKRITPLQAARRWAKDHPTESRELMILSLQRSAKYGYEWKVVKHWVYVANGQAQLSKMAPVWYGNTTHTANNGRCGICGTIYPDPVLVRAYESNPNAGKPTGLAQQIAGPNRIVRAACPACIDKHKLTPGWVPGAYRGPAGEWIENVLSPLESATPPEPEILDICNEQRREP